MRAHIYREHFEWGSSDGYTDGQGRFGFVERVRGRPRYFTPERMARRLEWAWRPAARVYLVTNLYAEIVAQLRAMPAL